MWHLGSFGEAKMSAVFILSGFEKHMRSFPTFRSFILFHYFEMFLILILGRKRKRALVPFLFG